MRKSPKTLRGGSRYWLETAALAPAPAPSESLPARRARADGGVRASQLFHACNSLSLWASGQAPSEGHAPLPLKRREHARNRCARSQLSRAQRPARNAGHNADLAGFGLRMRAAACESRSRCHSSSSMMLCAKVHLDRFGQGLVAPRRTCSHSLNTELIPRGRGRICIPAHTRHAQSARGDRATSGDRRRQERKGHSRRLLTSTHRPPEAFPRASVTGFHACRHLQQWLDSSGASVVSWIVGLGMPQA